MLRVSRRYDSFWECVIRSLHRFVPASRENNNQDRNMNNQNNNSSYVRMRQPRLQPGGSKRRNVWETREREWVAWEKKEVSYKKDGEKRMRRIIKKETSQTCLYKQPTTLPQFCFIHPFANEIVPARVTGALVTYLDDSVVEETRSRSRYTHYKRSCTNAHAHSSQNKLSTN